MKYKCDYCGKAFRRPRNQRRSEHKFCSRNCSNQYSKEHGIGKGTTGATSIARRKLQNIVAIKKMFGDIND